MNNPMSIVDPNQRAQTSSPEPDLHSGVTGGRAASEYPAANGNGNAPKSRPWSPAESAKLYRVEQTASGKMPTMSAPRSATR